MPKRFLISIIGLNRLDATRACIEAVFRHSKNFDLVLTNNASTDGTGDYFDQLARDYPNVTVFHEQENTGFIPPNNRGFDLAIKRKATYFIALNNDTVPQGRWL
ncbi:MAG: glycosyltransferase [Pirellulaceae bacterium]|jgi:GT2 family glycosyltransferase|nr:glycosyltransferase [Pirellulaceae bacterium]